MKALLSTEHTTNTTYISTLDSNISLFVDKLKSPEASPENNCSEITDPPEKSLQRDK